MNSLELQMVGLVPVCSFPREMAPCFHSVVIKGYWTPKSYPTITPERLRQREMRQRSRRKGAGAEIQKEGDRDVGQRSGGWDRDPERKGQRPRETGPLREGRRQCAHPCWAC